MPKWKHQVNVKASFHNDDMTFTQRRDAICKTFRKAPFWPKDHEELERADAETWRIWELVDELADTEGEDEFDWVWDEIYDWADRNRVWIATF